MTALSRVAPRLLRQLPLLLVCVLAAAPIVLWFVHRGDPELAVAIAQRSKRVLWIGAWALLGTVAIAAAVFPPASAWLRRAGSRTWLSLSMDQLPLHKLRNDLRILETASKHAELGRLLRLRRQNELASQHLARAVELDPEIARAWHQLGLTLFSQHVWAAAAKAFDRAEQLEAGHAFGDALLHLGRCLHELGDPRALSLLTTHRQRHGGGPRSHLWLAEALARAGDTAAAHEALRIAAARPAQRLSAEENWFRSLARVRLWGKARP